jgi:CRISPR system Cascade subunit CasD
MNTLLLRLSGAMQSWGVQSHFSIRDTGLEPSKSGVVGLICAALGVPRQDNEALVRLAMLKMGIRSDQEGVLKKDYHTAKDVLKAGGGIKDTELSNRYYLADAVFLVGLSGEDAVLLQKIHTALRRPVWALYLGRKAFVPGQTVWLADGLKIGMELIPALETYPYLGRKPAPERLRVLYEDPQGVIVRPDQPLSFSQRRFAPRRMTVTFISTPHSILEVP